MPAAGALSLRRYNQNRTAQTGRKGRHERGERMASGSTVVLAGSALSSNGPHAGHHPAGTRVDRPAALAGTGVDRPAALAAVLASLLLCFCAAAGAQQEPLRL